MMDEYLMSKSVFLPLYRRWRKMIMIYTEKTTLFDLLPEEYMQFPPFFSH